MLTGRVLDEVGPGVAGSLRGAVKRLGEPVIRAAVARAMKEMGRQFVLGEDIGAAMKRARELEAAGYTYSYDMLGEAARTEADARPLSRRIRRCDPRHRPGREIQRHPRQSRHLGQALRAAPALRGGSARPRDGGAGAPRARPRAHGKGSEPRLQCRRGGGGPPRPLARGYRGGAGGRGAGGLGGVRRRGAGLRAARGGGDRLAPCSGGAA